MPAEILSVPIPETMAAVRLHSYGGPESLVYETISVPQPNDQEVLIRVQAVGVNPADWKIREGHLKSVFPLDLPIVPGSDVAGVIVAVGKDVSYLKVGEHVYGTADMTRSGAYGQYAIAHSGAVAHKPGSLTAIEAASVPVAALTAWQALKEAAHIQPTDKVLIHGAGGMVGLFAIQFARRFGCHIVALSSHESIPLIREMGADTVLDYKKMDFEQYVSGIDIVFDTIGGEMQEKSWRTLKPGGILVTTVAPPPQDVADRHGVRARMIQMKPSAFQLRDIGQWLNTGELRTFVGKVFALGQAAEAQEAQRLQHIRGKVVLSVS